MAPVYTTDINYTTNVWPTMWIGTANGTGNYNATWQGWNGTASSTGSITVWENWTAAGTTVTTYYAQEPVELTPEQQETQRLRREQMVANQVAAAERFAEAKRRARALLVSMLDEPQQKELEKDGYFHVETANGTRVYRIKPGSSPLRIKSDDGQRYSYCIHTLEAFMSDDVALAQKLLLETDEASFLRIANAHRLSERVAA